MALERLSAESLQTFYNAVRKQVEADKMHNQNFIHGSSVRDYARTLEDEMRRRNISFSLIVWR